MTTIVANSRTDRKQLLTAGNVERGADEFVGTPLHP